MSTQDVKTVRQKCATPKTNPCTKPDSTPVPAQSKSPCTPEQKEAEDELDALCERTLFELPDANTIIPINDELNFDVFQELYELIFYKLDFKFSFQQQPPLYTLNLDPKSAITSLNNCVADMKREGHENDLNKIFNHNLLLKLPNSPFYLINTKLYMQLNDNNCDIHVANISGTVHNHVKKGSTTKPPSFLKPVLPKIPLGQKEKEFTITLFQRNMYTKMSVMFCNFVDPVYSKIIKMYTLDTSILNSTLVKAFTLDNFKLLQDIYVPYTFALYTFEMLKMFYVWRSNGDITLPLTPKEEPQSKPSNVTIYSGGHVLYNRQGIPLLGSKEKTIYLMAFMSTSIDRDLAEGFLHNCLYVINVPKEEISKLMPINVCSKYQHELEIILPVGTCFKVVDVEKTITTKRDIWNDNKLKTFSEYTVYLELQPYDMKRIENLMQFFGILSNKKNAIAGGDGDAEVPGPIVRKPKHVKPDIFFSEEDMDKLDTIMEMCKLKDPRVYGQIQDIGNHLCNRLKMPQPKCKGNEYKSSQTQIKNIVKTKCLDEDQKCIILPYVRYNIDDDDPDIGYINIDQVDDTIEAYFTYEPKVKERYNIDNNGLRTLDEKMAKFFESDNKFKENKYTHWFLHKMYNATTDKFERSIIKHMKQQITYT